MALITAVYNPPVPGLPYLAVVFSNGAADATPLETREDAEAYITVCDAGMASDALKSKGNYDAQRV